MSFIESIRTSAKRNPMRLILPEGTETRTLQAARIILDEGLAASVTLIGCPAEIEKTACSAGRFQGVLSDHRRRAEVEGRRLDR